MGYFKEIEIDVIDMFHSEGMKEAEIAKSLGISLTEVYAILAAYDNDCDVNADESYDESDSDDDYNAEHY